MEWGGPGGAWFELASAPAHPRWEHDAGDGLVALAFDGLEEAAWAGTAGGLLLQLAVGQGGLPLAPYACVPAHTDRVIDVRALGEAAVSLSAAELAVHASGGAPRLHWQDEVGDLAALELEPRSSRVVLGRAGGGLVVFDLQRGQPTAAVDTGGRGVVGLCGPTGRGALVMGSADGYIALLDGRSGYRPADTALQAHPGGFAALDARGDLVATCGYAHRMGRLVLDTYAKVFDVRMTPRMLSTVPFAPGPSLLSFHPRFPSTLLLASAGGAFTLADAQGMGGGAFCQVETEGDALLSAAISSSGECLAFGGSGGYLHLWAASAEPAVNQMRQPLAPPEPPTPLVSLGEDDPLSLAPTYFPPDGGGLLSDLGPYDTMAVSLPPRVVEPALLRGMKQSDFVGHIPNPHYVRGAPYGAAARAAARQRNARVTPRPGTDELEAARVERARARAAAGGSVLPGRYRCVAVRAAQAGLRSFEELDAGYYNRTPFTGLENDLANCYTNALLQVLFFTPAMRDALMQHVPDPGAEFSLTDEMALLFRMLATAASGTVCQAANLLRALRQNKEAAGLGLLEGVKGERGVGDIELEAKKERSLARRVQSLCRFLLEALNKEGSAAAGGRASAVDAAFGLVQRQRTQCLSRAGRPDQVRETRVFQVDLLYPPAKDRPAPLAPPGSARGDAAAPGSTPASPDAQAALRPAALAGGADGGGSAAPAARPSFAALLQSSLKVESEMRAWFDEEVRYQYVRQTRVPRSLPQVLAVNCGRLDGGDAAWWQPYAEPGVDGEGEPVTRTRPWLPHAIAVTADPDGWGVAVAEGVTPDAAAAAAAAAGPVPPGGSRAVYELTAVVALIRDEDEAAEAAESGQEYEGHLVAHIKVPPTYFGAQEQSPAGGTPHALSRVPSDTDTAAATAAGGGGAGPGTPGGASPREVASLLLPGAGTATPPRQGLPPGPHLSPLHAQASPPGAGLSAEDADAIRRASGGLAAALGGGGPAAATPPAQQAQQAQRYSWLVFNDFHITPSLPGEVGELYGGQKLPCLLFWTRAEEVARAAECPPLPSRPVLTPEALLALCRMPPLQGPKVRLHKPTFAPLLPSELPQPGTLFALDAEFVAYSPPEKALVRGVETEVRPSRLGLARVSVLRGQGPAKGAPCIDDYIRSAEPVHDHLTKYSGLVPGDLDPSRSPHHLTTLKRAYLKLRALVDAGAVFVGHGLKKDFRMINIVVPPGQIVDTVDLFHAPRSRKLSLRFLASYLLRATIQEHTHDSVEDAATALKLYDCYQQLVREGTFEAKLAELYEWGKRFGWEPVVWLDGQPHPAPAKPDAPAGAPYGGGGGMGPGGGGGGGMGLGGGMLPGGLVGAMGLPPHHALGGPPRHHHAHHGSGGGMPRHHMGGGGGLRGRR